MVKIFKSCSVINCNRNAHNSARGRRGLCPPHYRRYLAYGDAGAGRAIKGEGLSFILSHISYDGVGCLIWPFGRFKTGYGNVGDGSYAHRKMCREVNGNAPSPKHYAIHSCGNGHEGCIHPKHLRWALPVENSQDAKCHGTWAHGQTNGRAVLTETNVVKIRELRGAVSQSELARMFGVHQTTICNIMTRKNWGWLP